MKEVVKVSIAGVAFSLSADAYRKVKEYLDRLERSYPGSPEGREVVADIEARLAELLLEGMPDSHAVVDTALAESVIVRLGFPDDAQDDAQPAERLPRRLHRNPEGAVLGGVCSGIGAYFRVDPVWVRLCIFLPVVMAVVFSMAGMEEVGEVFAILFGICVVLYPALWIIVPMARTPRQKLEMRGERVTASSIKRTLENDAAAMASSSERRTASVWADVFYVIGRILLFCIKALVFIMGIGVCLALVAVLVCVVATIFGTSLVMNEWVFDALSCMEGVSPVWYVVLMLLAGFIPLLMLVCLLFRLIFGVRTNRTFMWILLVIWVMLTTYLSVVTIHNSDNLVEGFRRMEYRWNRESVFDGHGEEWNEYDFDNSLKDGNY